VNTLTTTDNPHDDRPTWKWIVGVALALLFAVSGSVLKSNADRVTALEQTAEIQGRAVAKLETKSEAFKDQLDRIEIKLDRVLYGPPGTR